MTTSTTITGSLFTPLPSAPMPKRIWAYWTSQDLPPLVAACVRTWRKTNPAYEIDVVTPKTLGNYVSDIPEGLFDQTPQRQSDWARLALLAAHGGIYMDATIVLAGGLGFIDQLLESNGSEAFGYYLNRWTRDASRPVIESWMIASRPNSTFMRDWKSEFENAIRLGATGYVKALKRDGNFEVLRQRISAPAYLNIHLSAQKILSQDHAYRVTMLKAEAGPYSIHHQFAWKRGRISRALSTLDISQLDQSDVTKLRGWEWRAITKLMQNPRVTIARSSFVGTYFGADAPD